MLNRENARIICKKQDSIYDITMFQLWYIRQFLTPILEILWIYIWFKSGYFLRSFTDGIPFVQLRIPYISEEQFFPFIILGCILWVVIFSSRWLYSSFETSSFFDEVQRVVKSSFIWAIIFIFIVYLWNGYVFTKEIPRLIILYVFVFSIVYTVLIRSIFYSLRQQFIRKNSAFKRRFIVITKWSHFEKYFRDTDTDSFTYMILSQKNQILDTIREGKIRWIINMTWAQKDATIQEILTLTRVYGIAFIYPKFLPDNLSHIGTEYIVSWIPVIEIRSISLWFWWLFFKRMVDIVVSASWLIILSPILMIVAIIIKIEDPSGPIIFKNRRIWRDGKIFDLFKFRYMYWKYSVKDAYGVNAQDDSALKFEESLKISQDSRHWPLYKIENDPRKTKFWKIIERLSIDELPQLINVLRGDMSIIGPRPHQPREVELYDEEDRQVLIIKPGITGMAQVYGREKNSFKQEIALDRYYIENYSLLLDWLIFLRTFLVVLIRIFRK